MPGLTELPTFTPDSLDTTRVDRIPYAGEPHRVSARLVNKMRIYLEAMGRQLGLGDGTTEDSLQYVVDRLATTGAAPVEIAGLHPLEAAEFTVLGILDPARFSDPEIAFRAIGVYANEPLDAEVVYELYDFGAPSALLSEPILRASLDLPYVAGVGGMRQGRLPLTINANAGVNLNQILPGPRVYLASWRLLSGDPGATSVMGKVWLDVKGTVLGGTPSGGGTGGVRVAEFVVGNAGRESNEGVDFVDPGDGSGVKAACEAASALGLGSADERVQIVVRNGEYSIPPGGFWDACANVDLIAESDGGVTFVSPAGVTGGDCRTGILRAHATMSGCNLRLSVDEQPLPDPEEPPPPEHRIPLTMESFAKVRGGTWTVPPNEYSLMSLCFAGYGAGSSLEGIEILDVDLAVQLSPNVGTWQPLMFLYAANAAERLPGSVPNRIEGGVWYTTNDDLELRVNSDGAAFDFHGITFVGPWNLHSGPTRRVPSAMTEYRGPLLEGLTFLPYHGEDENSTQRSSIFISMEVINPSVWIEPTVRNIAFPSATYGAVVGIVMRGIYAGGAPEGGFALSIVRPTFEDVRASGAPTMDDNYALELRSVGAYVEFASPRFKDVHLAVSGSSSSEILIKGTGFDEGSEGEYPVLTDACFDTVHVDDLSIGDGWPMRVGSILFDGVSRCDDIRIGDGVPVTVEGTLTFGPAVRVDDIDFDVEPSSKYQLPPIFDGQQGRVFRYYSFPEIFPPPPELQTMRPDARGTYLFQEFNYSRGYRYGDLIQLIEGHFGFVTSWRCVDDGVWRPEGRLAYEPRELPTSPEPGTNVAALGTVGMHVADQGGEAVQLSGAFTVTPTAPGLGSVLIDVFDFAWMHAETGFPHTYCAQGVATCFDEAAPAMIPGQVRTRVGTTQLEIFFVFATAAAGQAVTWSATLDQNFNPPS